jgi:hypothetical protein
VSREMAQGKWRKEMAQVAHKIPGCFAGASAGVGWIFGAGAESFEGLVYRTMENNETFLD